MYFKKRRNLSLSSVYTKVNLMYHTVSTLIALQLQDQIVQCASADSNALTLKDYIVSNRHTDLCNTDVQMVFDKHDTCISTSVTLGTSI